MGGERGIGLREGEREGERYEKENGSGRRERVERQRMKRNEVLIMLSVHVDRDILL